jgi:hypothetical protein
MVKMKMLNNDPLDLSGDQDEKITISITSSYPGGPAYNINLNGSTFAGSSFTLDKNVKNPYQLLVSVIFKTNSGGSYKLTVQGSNGGDTSTYTINQYAGQASNAVTYTIDVQ